MASKEAFLKFMDNIITEKIKGVEIKFKTKSGVFSKDRLDLGSRLLLENVEITDGSLVADLGAGSGVIGLVVAKLNREGHVHLLEDHLRAVNLAKGNVELNKLKNVEVFLSDFFSAVGERTYQLILSNPPQHLGNELLEEAVKECFDHLKKGGEVYWVIQKHVKPFVERLFQKYFKNCTMVAQNKDYVLLKGVKLSS